MLIFISMSVFNQSQIQELITENNNLKEKLKAEEKRRKDLAEKTQVHEFPLNGLLWITVALSVTLFNEHHTDCVFSMNGQLILDRFV